MNTWKKIIDWFTEPLGLGIIIISSIIGIGIFCYNLHKEFESQYDYTVKIMDSRDGTTYYVKKDQIEIIDGVLYIKPNNITTTQFIITKIK